MLRTTSSSDSPMRVGVFDSGVGGLSVLRVLREHLPGVELFYVADSAHAPYGEKSEAFVIDRSLRIAEHLRRHQCQALVMACNTATAAAVQQIRERHSDGVVVGVEPGVKPAASLTHNGRVGVMATSGTLRSEKFRLLAQAHAAHIQLTLQPCPGLAAAIETGRLDAPNIRELIAIHTAPLREAEVDTVVLGCTHYPFVQEHIQRVLGSSVQLIDTAQAVARHTARMLQELSGAGSRATAIETPLPHLQTTGDPHLLSQFAQRWLDFHCSVDPAPLQI